MELAGGRAERVVLSYRGRLADHDTRLLTVAALNGVFQGRTEQPVNSVNASLVAAERGISVEEQSDRSSPDYTSLVEVCLRTNGDETSVSGTTLGGQSRHWLVGVLGFKIEIELAPLMVFFQYDDRPGVIGHVGTLFGRAGVNIANMAVSRTDEGGRAMMALSIDTPASPELVAEFRAAGFHDASFIRLP
jgi:D-3-phosphoglycerate dehydrogenase